MKSLLLIVSTFVLTIAVHAQSPKVSVLGTNVQVAADYGADTRATRTATKVVSNPVASDTQGAFENMGDIADSSAGKKYKLSIEVRNDDTKTIRAIIVEYPVGYSRRRKSLEYASFKSKKEIKPGETVTLKHSLITSKYVSPFGPTIVKRIDYADGSVWRR